MPDRRRGLGRGLDSLIPGFGNEQADSGVVSADIDALSPNPLQPRSTWNTDELDELARSIAEHGVIQPIIVAYGTDTVPYRIIAGERRWRAARRAGLTSVPILIRDASSLEALELAIVENIQRSDLNPIEEATAYQHLIDEFGLTQKEVAQQVGKSRPAVANSIRLLDADASVQEALAGGQISAGHARALLPLEYANQRQALEQIVKKRLNVRQVEQLASKLARPPKPKSAPVRERDPATLAVERELRRALGTKVELKPGKRGGRLVIHYYSDEELTAIIEKITDSRF